MGFKVKSFSFLPLHAAPPSFVCFLDIFVYFVSDKKYFKITVKKLLRRLQLEYFTIKSHLTQYLALHGTNFLLSLPCRARELELFCLSIYWSMHICSAVKITWK